MSWFDESDEEDNGNNNDHSNDSSGNGNITGASANGEDSEEDPLDAYMKSLEPPAPSSVAAANLAGGRLDHDAEEEATSHWQIDRNAVDEKSAAHLLPKVANFGDDDHCCDVHQMDLLQSKPSQAAREARSAMSSTFIPAGGRKKEDDENGNERNEDSEDSENEYDDLQKQLHKKHIQMQHEEIDPLEKIDHGKMKYAPFRRQFYTPPDTETGHAWRREHEVTCTPPKFDPILGFGELDFSTGNTPEKNRMTLCPPELLKKIAKQGYDAPTPVQSQTLPVALSGNDAIITASTGSGKTLSYIWPLVIHISDQPYIQPGVDGPIGVVLTPTRELAKQVYKYAKIFIECIGGKVVEVAGGNKGTWELIKELKKGCEVLVGTPGRVIDVVKKKGTNLGRITFVVLDEADRMLDMGFEKQVTSILENIRPDRQTLLLSATFAKRVEKVARRWLHYPVRIAIGRTGASSEHVDQHVMVLPSRDSKIQWLVEMLPVLSSLGRCLIFVATRADCDTLSQMIQSSSSFSCGDSTTLIVSIHGDKNQTDRNSAISQFKKNPQAILIATDVAARGLDIPNVMTVVNFDAAKNIDSHVHRVGRAGRLQKDGHIDGGHQRGTAYTLLTDKDADFAQTLVEAFEREGRTTSQELVGLAHKSKRFGGGRMKNNKTGLGFGGNVKNPASTTEAIRLSSHHTREDSNGRASYGPSDPPITKRSRWG